MSLGTGVGAEGNLLAETPEHAHQLVLDQPILRNHELETLRQSSTTTIFRAHTIDITWPVADGPRRHAHARSPSVCDEAHDAIADGVNILILSDRARRPRARADPVAARRRRRAPPPRARGHAPAGGPRARVRRAARGPPHRDADRLRRERDQPVPAARHRRRARRRRPRRRASTTSTRPRSNIVKAIGKGLLKTISKMGISTIQSYCGAQIFEAVGLEQRARSTATSPAPRRASAASASTSSRSEALDRHAARLARRRTRTLLPVGGVYAWRRDGEHHMWNPETIALLQHAVRASNGDGAGEVRRVRRAGQRRRRAPRDAARAADVPRRTHDADRRSRRSSRRRRSSSASPPARCRSGSISTRGARDARDRDEPPRRQVEHRRGRRGPASASRPTPTATCAARRSSRSPPGASA